MILEYSSVMQDELTVGVNDRIVVNPSDSIEEGQQVNVAPEHRGEQHS